MGSNNRLRNNRLFFILLFCFMALGCGNASIDMNEADTDMAKARLGRYLFNDTRLSRYGNRSCALCHSPQHGWSNSFSKAPDIDGVPGQLNTPSLLNASRFKHFSQVNPVVNLEQAIVSPLFGIMPTEMGMTPDLLTLRLSVAHDLYPPLFERAYGDKQITAERVIEALLQYVNTLNSTATGYHAFQAGHTQALTPQAQRGLALFNSSRLKCSQCHGGEYFNTPKGGGLPYLNVGLYGPKQQGSKGLQAITGHSGDEGKFRVPSLINVTNTPPWGHDGSFQSLEALIEAYARGGRRITTGANSSDGKMHPNKDARISGFIISPMEKADLLAFLHALSITDLADEGRHRSPFCTSRPSPETRAEPACIPAFSPNIE